MIYQRSLTSLTAHLWFSIVGVSLAKANAVGVFLSLGGLIFFLLAVSRHHRSWVTLALTVCYLINISLLVHGRLSYLENGLIFITSLLFFVYSRWGDKYWGIYVSGGLVAAAMLMGKLFGVLLLPALVLTIWFSSDEERIKKVSSAVGAFAVALVVLAAALYATNLSAVSGYFGEQSYGLRGFPEGLSSPWAFVEHLISYSFLNRMFFLDLDLLVFMWTGGFLLTYLMAGGGKLRQLSPVTLLSMFATGCIFLGLMPLNYSPIRYALFMMPLIIIFCLSIFDGMISTHPPRPRRISWPWLVLLFLLLWQMLFQVIGLAFYIDNIQVRTLTWAMLPVAAGLTFLIRYLLNRGKLAIGQKTLYTALVAVLLFSVAINTYRIKTRVLVTSNTSMKEGSDDLQDILAEGAVVSCPYAAALTTDNQLKSFIHLFGVASVDSTLFERFPITHLAIDSSNWQEAVKCYPAFKDMNTITAYWIRDHNVKITNVVGHFDNKEANSYRESTYERAVRCWEQQKDDSAWFALREFLTLKPHNRSGNILLVTMLMNAGRYEEVPAVLSGLARHHPTDYYSLLICGTSYQILGMTQKDNSLIELGKRYYEQAAQNNRFKITHAQSIFDQTRQQFMSNQAGNTP